MSAVSSGVPAATAAERSRALVNLALPLGVVASLVAPGPGEDGPPRVVFDPGVAA